MAQTFKPGRVIICKNVIHMMYAGENNLIYILMYNISASLMPKYRYFKIICEINLFITWLKSGLKVA